MRTNHEQYIWNYLKTSRVIGCKQSVSQSIVISIVLYSHIVCNLDCCTITVTIIMCKHATCSIICTHTHGCTYMWKWLGDRTDIIVTSHWQSQWERGSHHGDPVLSDVTHRKSQKRDWVAILTGVLLKEGWWITTGHIIMFAMDHRNIHESGCPLILQRERERE